MPCAAPCDRLPCDERCNKILDCGHQCPSLCGEDCPNDLCQKCSDKGDARVDLLEFKTYSETNLDESPIVVLGCGHFFTSESFDGLVGLDKVYTRDKAGDFNGLRNVSALLASAMPSCPDCKRPIRQFTIKRYNRVINRAVLDETYKRFLTKGRIDLEVLEHRLKIIEDELHSTRQRLGLREIREEQLITRHAACNDLAMEALTVSRKTNAEHQPKKKLMDAVALSRKLSDDETLSVSHQMNGLRISTPAPDNQITLGARLIHIMAREVILHDRFSLVNSKKSPLALPFNMQPHRSTIPFLKDCRDLVMQAKGARLSRVVIAATLVFAKVSQLDGWYHRAHPGQTTDDTYQERLEYTGLRSVEDRVNTTRGFLVDALERCAELGNCEELRERVQEITRLFEGPRYEGVTPEELVSIKTAMVSGRGGIATNSGHWYNCINGHPVSYSPKDGGTFYSWRDMTANLVFFFFFLVCDRRMRYADRGREMP